MGIRTAIRLINYRVYFRLKLMGKVLKRGITDVEYEALLKKTYPKIEVDLWEKYCKIVKAATFSEGERTKEELEFCYRMYRQIRGQSKETE